MIETERLILREWTLNDVDDQVEGLSNFETSKNLTVPFPYTKDNSLAYINKHSKNNDTHYAFAIVLKENNKVIGGTSLEVREGKYDGGIWFNQKYIGKGYGTEAWIARTKFAFEVLQLKEIECSYFAFNDRSKHMQEKVGYKSIGQSSKFCPALNREVIEIKTRLTKEDFYKAMESIKLKEIFDKVRLL